MQVQGKLRAWLTVILAVACLCSLSRRAAADPAACFDFAPGAQPVSEPLRPLTERAVPHDESGVLPDGYAWAAVHAEIDQPIDRILKDLLTHHSTKSSRVSRMVIHDVPDSRYLARQSVDFEVDPFPFVHVRWTEAWSFFVSKATPGHPARVLVSYEKVSGTSHISHLCGNYLLEKKGPKKTDVYIYEEVRATGRDARDTQKGLEGNLQSFRQLK